jgi:hypothetical protein
MSIVLDGSGGITTPMYNGTISANAVTPSVSMKNRIINGAMVIDQRNAGASITPTTDGTYSVDRWCIRLTAASKLSMQQNAGSVTPPAGFVNYLGITSTSSYSASSTDIFALSQIIEGYNMADLAWGTASAKAVTLSFWVYSSKTGQFGGSLFGNPANYSYPFSYTISSANTWTQISINIAGPTGGTGWTQTNGAGIYLNLDLGNGSSRQGTAGAWASGQCWGATGDTSIVATSGATFYITGVQLEVGSSATSFDYRQYGQELALCQRYYEKSYNDADIAGASGKNGYCVSTIGANSNNVTAGAAYSAVHFKVTKRTQPTITIYGFSGASTNVSNGSSGVDLGTNSGGLNSSGINNFSLANLSGGSLTTATYAVIWHFVASAEL